MIKPYDAETWHCWSLVEALVPNAPKVEVVGGSYKLASRGFESNAKTIADTELVTDDPKEGDVILVGSDKYLSHAGVLLIDSGNLLVVENSPKGTQVVPFLAFVQQFKVFRVYRC